MKNEYIKENSLSINNQYTNVNYNQDINNEFEISNNNPINKNKIFNQTYSNNFRKSYRNSKNLNLNMENINNNGLNINIILGVTKRDYKRINKGQEEQKVPKTSPYNFKYFCNTANKKSFSRALSTNSAIMGTNHIMESNFINLSKEANIYTANANYIKNKKLLLFDKYNFENNKYKPNRANLFDMTSIPQSKNRTHTVYKTTRFRGGRMFNFDIVKNTPSITESKSNNNIINMNKKPLYLQDLEKFQLKTQNEFFRKNRIDKYVDNSFQNRKRHPPSNSLYKELVSKKNEIYDNFVNNKISGNDNIYYPLFKSVSTSIPPSPTSKEESDADKKNNKNSNLNGYSNLLYKKKNDGIIPITYPLICSNEVNCDTISQRKRFENIMETFIKLKSLIENDRKLGKNNEINYLIEFIINKKIDKKYITNRNISNFSDFLNSSKLPIDTSKSLKENIILALNYDKNDKNIIISENINNRDSIDLGKKYDIKNKNKNIIIESKFNNKPLQFDLERQRKLFINEVYKNDFELRDALKKELDFVENDVENQQSKIKQIEDNLNLLPFEENYYYKQKLNRKPKLPKKGNKEFLLISHQGYYKAIVPYNNAQNIKMKEKKRSKTNNNLFDSNERLYYTWYKNKNKEEIQNYIKNSKLTEYIIYNRTKDKIIKNKLKEIAEKRKMKPSKK